MAFFYSLGAAFLFALACNLDTILLSMGFAVKGIHIVRGGTLIIALVTTLVTWLSLLLGETASRLLSPSTSEVLGGIVLLGIGFWFLLDFLRQLGGPASEEEPPRTPGIWGCVSLAAALAVNNAGIGVAAGVAGLGVWQAAGWNFLVTLLALPLGRALGRRLAGKLLGRYALPLSGLLLVALGLWEVLG